MDIEISNKILIKNSTAQETYRIQSAFSFNNPDYEEAMRMGRKTFGIPKTEELCSIQGKYLSIPLGGLEYIKKFNPNITDNRSKNTAEIPFNGEARPYQEKCILISEKEEIGIIVAATGSGKTFIGIALASRLKQRTLILVKSKELASQWKNAIKQFTGLESGLISGRTNKEGNEFTVGLTQTLSKRDLSGLNYGLVIADECHNLPAVQSFSVINSLNSFYKIGLSATPQRRDDKEFMLYASLGKIIVKIKEDEIKGKVLPVNVCCISFDFYENVDSWQDFQTKLTNHRARNNLIIKSALKCSLKMGTIILCYQTDHCDILGDLAKEQGINALVIHGKLKSKTRNERMAIASESQLIIGTLSLLSEGIDFPHIKALIFASPVSAKIDKEDPAATRLVQSIGRCRRPFGNHNKSFVLDIVDQCAFGISAYRKRCEIYNLNNFKIINL